MRRRCVLARLPAPPDAATVGSALLAAPLSPDREAPAEGGGGVSFAKRERHSGSGTHEQKDLIKQWTIHYFIETCSEILN